MARKKHQQDRCYRQRSEDEVAGPSEQRTGRSDRTTSLDSSKAWWMTAAMWGLPALAAAVVFANTLSNELVYDDRWTLKRIPSLSIATLFDALHRSRGLTYAVHSLDKWLWGDWSPGFHVTNVVLHAVASALAAYAAFALTSCRRVALLCGLLFAVHPVHVEVVASFSYRKDSLAMIFVLLSLILWLGSRRPILRYAGSIFCLLLGLVSKEVAAVGLVPMLFLVDLLPGHGHPGRWQARFKRAAWRSVPFFGLGLVAGIWFVTNVSMDSILDGINHESNGRLAHYGEILATAVGSVLDVVRLLLVPGTLSADYPIGAQTSFTDSRALAGVLVLGCWILGTIALIRRAPLAALAAAWALLTYVPCSNILPLTHLFVAERYLYVPSFGACLLVALGLNLVLVHAVDHRRFRLRGVVTAFATLLIVVGGVRSAVRNRDWRDDRSLWLSSLHAGVETNRIHGNLGAALMGKSQLEESIEHLSRAWELHRCTKWLRPLAHAFFRLGRLREAAGCCREILKTQPKDAQTRSLLDKISRLHAKSVETTSMMSSQ